MELLEIINEFTVKNINNSIEFYNKYFDFQIEEEDGNPVTWVKMRKDNCTIMFESYDEVCKEIDNYPKKVKTSNLIKFKYNDKEKVFNLYNEFLSDNIKFFMGLKNTEYGSVEFGIFDLDENMIIISC